MSLWVLDTGMLTLFPLERKALCVVATVVSVIPLAHDRLWRAEAEPHPRPP
jgi:hypothetical protein